VMQKCDRRRLRCQCELLYSLFLCIHACTALYRVVHKSNPPSFWHNCIKYWPAFKIYSLAHLRLTSKLHYSGHKRFRHKSYLNDTIRYDMIICNAHDVCQLAESEARAVTGGKWLLLLKSNIATFFGPCCVSVYINIHTVSHKVPL